MENPKTLEKKKDQKQWKIAPEESKNIEKKKTISW